MPAKRRTSLLPVGEVWRRISNPVNPNRNEMVSLLYDINTYTVHYCTVLIRHTDDKSVRRERQGVVQFGPNICFQ